MLVLAALELFVDRHQQDLQLQDHKLDVKRVILKSVQQTLALDNFPMVVPAD